MAAFTYTALDDKGQQTIGTVAAENRGAALDQVFRLGLHPVRVEERERAGGAGQSGGAGGGRRARLEGPTWRPSRAACRTCWRRAFR